MAASGSYNFVVTRDQLIADALLNVGAISEGETPTAAAVTEAARVLNMLLKFRASDGMPLYAMRRGTILPFTGASSITTASHVVTEYVSTTFGADEATSQTTLTLTSTAGISSSYEIGLELDDGTMQWTTVSSVSDGTTLIVATGLTSAASEGNRVYAYTASSDRIQRPLRIIEANVLQLSDNSSWDITVEESTDYWRLGDRTSTGTPNRIYYEAVLGTRTASPDLTYYGNIYVYPRFDGGSQVVEFTYQEPMQDLDSADDSPYVPQEFYLPLMLELSALLGPRHGLSIEERNALKQEAKMYLDQALTTLHPQGSLFLQPGPFYGDN